MSVVASPLGVESRGSAGEITAASDFGPRPLDNDLAPPEPEPAAPTARGGSAGLVQRSPDDTSPPPPPPTNLGGAGDSGAQPTDTQGGGGSSTTITVKAATRTLSAPNLTALWTALTNSGVREAASVKPTFTPAPQYEYDDNDKVKKVTVTVVETKEMPQWTEADVQCPPIKGEWTRFYGVLDAHEDRHLAIDKKHFTNVHTKLVGKKKADAWQALDDEIAAADQENDAYDTQTDHGVKEGANINTAVQCAPEKIPKQSTADGSGAIPTEQPSSSSADAPVRSDVLQAKLEVSEPGDPLEEEADRAAASVERGDSVERPLSPASTGIRRQCAAPEPCECDHCRAQMAGAGKKPESIVNRAVEAGGAPLDHDTRRFMESRFGHDFGRVRIYSGESAAAAAAELGSHAFTVGADVVFAAGRYAPGTPAGRRLLAHELTHVVQQGGAPEVDRESPRGLATALPSGGPIKAQTSAQRRIARAVDPSKAAPIKKELDSTFYVSNSKLEDLWGALGVDLPEAINEPAYRDLWQQSVLKEKINVSNAARPLIAAFGGDSLNAASSILSSQHTRLVNLQHDLEKAAKQNVSVQPPDPANPTGVEDKAKQVSRDTTPKPMLNASSLVDSATILHFLLDWKTILQGAPIGMRRVPNSTLLPAPGQVAPTPAFNPFPNSPGSGLGGPGQSPSANGGASGGLEPINYHPETPIDRILETPNLEFVDRAAFAAIEKAYRDCTEKSSLFKELAEAMLAEDANLAVLHERGELNKVSALSGASDQEAGGAIINVAKDNAEKCKTFLDKLGSAGAVDWKALRPIHGYLLAGGGGRRDWSHFTARGFIEGYFKDQAEAARVAAERQLYLSIGISAVTFIAFLTPAAPLAAAVLAATTAYGAVSALGSIADSTKADKKADVMKAGADAGVVDKDDARRAKEEAQSKKVAMVMDVVTNVLPFLPSIAKGGAKAVGALGAALGRESTWASLAKYGALNSLAGAGGELVVDLAKAGVSAIARNRVGGTLSLVEILSRIRSISRTLGFVPVESALVRGGDEALLHPASEYGLSDYIRYHVHGPGTGLEGYPIFMAPTRANQFANNSIEGFMRRERDLGNLVEFSATYATFNAEEMRPFVEQMLRSGDPKILGRLAMDQGLIEKFLKAATYDIRVTRGGVTTRYMANITIGAPGSGVLTTLAPKIVP